MNKLFTTLVTGLALVFSLHLSAQPNFSIDPPSITASPGDQITVDIIVSNFVDILSIQYSMNWDPTVLDFVSVSNLSPDLPGLVQGNFGTNSNNVDNGNMTVSWFDPNVAGVTLPDNTVLYTLTFDVLSTGGTDISFSGNPLFEEIVDSNGNDVGYNPTNGTVNGGGGGGGGNPQMTIAASNETGQNGDMICVDVLVNDFTDITDFAFSMNFDETVLQFDNFDNLNLTGLDAGDFDSSNSSNGQLTLDWSNATGVTVTNGTTIFQACFTIIGNSGDSSPFDFTDTPLTISATNASSEPVTVVTNDGSVNVTGGGGGGNNLIISASDVTGDPGDQVCIDVSVENFDNILSFQYSMNFDETVLQFDNFQNLNLQDLTNGNFGTGGAANGELTVSWFDNTNVSGVTIPDGTVIYQACFTIIGSGGDNSGFDITGSPTIIEVVDGDGNNVNVTANNGSVSVNGGGGGNNNLIISASDVTGDPGDQVCIDVSVENFDNILSFQYSMNFDETVLQFDNFQNLNLQDLTNGNFGTGGAANGELTVSWFDNTNVTGVTIPDGTVIYQACFTIIGSAGQNSGFDITGSPTIIEVVDGDGNNVNVTANNGSVSVNGGGGGNNNLIISASDVTGDPGDQVCIDISVENFDNILSFQYSMNFDETVLQFDNFQNLNLQDLTNGNFGTGGAANGELTVSWFDNTNVSGVTVPDGTVIFQACFTIIGSAGQNSGFDITGSPTIIEVVDGDGNNVNVTANNGSVSVNGGGGGGNDNLIISASDVTGDPGDQVCIDISVENFDNILSFQYSMNFDEAILQFDNFQNLNLQDLTNGNFGTGGAANGNLTVSWFDNTNVSGVTVPDGTVIYQACFTIIGSAGQNSGFDITGSPTIIEVVDGDGNNVNVTANNGSVSVNSGGGNPGDLVITASDVMGSPGDQVCVQVSVENFDNVLSFQFSMNFDPAVLQFDGFQNLNLQDLTNGNFGTGGAANGDLTVSWFDNTNVSGVTVPDGTIIFEACFTIIGGAGSSSTFGFSSSPTIVEIVDGDGNPINHSFDNGSVSTGGTGNPDLIISASDETGDPGDQVCVDVNVQNFTDITDFQFSMNFDEAILQFDNFQNLNLTGLGTNDFDTSNAGNGSLTLNWSNGSGVTVGNGTTIFQACFTIIGSAGDNSPFSFTDTPLTTSATHANNDPITVVTNNGSVSVNSGGGSGDLIISASDVTGNPGDQVCVEVSVQNFNNILSFQYSMNFDPSVLQFDGFQNLNLQDLTNGNFGVAGAANGNLSVSWFDNTNVSGVDVPDGTVIFEACFTIIGGMGSSSPFGFSNSPTIIEIVDGDGNTVPHSFDNGSVTATGIQPPSNDFTMIAPDINNVSVGDEVCVPVSVEGFNNILSFQYSMNFDPNILEFSSIQNLNLQDLTLGNFGTGGVDNGNLTVSWFDNTNVSGVTVPDGTVIFEVCFIVVGGGTSDFDFSGNPTVIEVVDGDGNAVTFNANNGSVTASGPPPPMGFSVNASDIVLPAFIPSGEMFCLDVSVQGFDNILSMQYSMNFDPNLWQFESVGGFNLQDLTSGSFGDTEVDQGNLTISWFDNTNASGVTVADNTVIYEVCFTAIGPNDCDTETQMIFTGNPTIIEVTDGDGMEVPFNSNPGNVVIGEDCGPPPATLEMNFPDVTAQLGSNICVPLTVENFIDVVSMQFSICYNEAVLDCTGFQNFNTSLGSFGTSNTNTDPHTVSWFDQDLNGNTLPNGTVLMEVCFDFVGGPNDVGCIEVCDNPTVIEVSNGAGQTVPVTTNEGCVTGNDNCTGPISITSEQITNVNCNGETNGQIDITDDGGFENTYSWTDANGNVVGTMQDLIGVGAGSYTITITGCSGSETFSQTYTITEPDALTIEVTNVTDVLCNGQSTGSISLNVTGGNGGNTFNWNEPEATGQNPSNLPAGNYVVTVTDNMGCSEVSNIIEVTQPDAITGQAIPTDAACAGETGSITINADGGVGNYTYSIFPAVGTLSGNTFLNVPEGTYSPSITDENGCTLNLPIVMVGAPDALGVSLGNSGNDNNNCDGFLDINVTGGSGSFTYQWTGPNNFSAFIQDINNLCGGDYCVTVTDIVGNCMINDCFTVIPTLQVSLVSSEGACFETCDGEATIQIDGGVAPFSIDWGDGNPTMDLSNDQLCGGITTITVTSDDGQTATLEIDIEEPNSPIQIVSQNIAGVSAPGMCDGQIMLNVVGSYDDSPYDFDWNLTTQNAGTITGLCEGEHFVTITDENGCTLIGGGFNVEFIPDPLMIVDTTNVDVNCFGDCDGTLHIEVTGGLPPYSVDVLGSGQTIPPGTGPFDISNLCGGVYQIQITDQTGQFDMANVEIAEPEEIQVTVNKINDTTNGGMGSVDITPTGGTPFYDFIWSNGAVAQNPPLPVGVHDLTIQDFAGCIKSYEDLVTIYDLKILTTDFDQAPCPDDVSGGIDITITQGNNPPYTFLWQDADGNNISSSQNLTNVSEGTYTLTVTDACDVSFGDTYILESQSHLTVELSSPIDFNGFDLQCNGDENALITVDVQDGVIPFTYNWNHGGDNNTELGAGEYFVTVTDGAGCTVIETIALTEPDAIGVVLDTTHISCFGETDGRITASAFGGVNLNGYSYLWNNGQETQAIAQLPAGQYNVLIQDDNNCDVDFSVEILEPEQLELSGISSPVTDTELGSARVVVNGGTAPFTYFWGNEFSEQTEQQIDLQAGKYPVIVTDANGCSEMITITVEIEAFCLDVRTTISPNDDGLNENFIIRCLANFTDTNLEIYNRWGQLVFEMSDYDDSWTGTNRRGNPVPEGTYFFVFDYTDPNTGEVGQRRGHITVIRD